MTYTTPAQNPKTAAWRQLECRLLWLYGEDRTIRILRGWDAETQADLAKWRRLGHPQA